MALTGHILGFSPGDHGCDRTLGWLAHAAIEGGLDLLVLREPHLSRRAYVDLARRLSPDLGTGLILHSSHDHALTIAQLSGWGLHMNGKLDWSQARGFITGLLGASCHSLDEAIAAQDASCDYLTLSPIFPPFSKPSDEREPLGLDGLQRIVDAVEIPVFALGGIDADNASAVREMGAHGVASMGYLFPADADADVCNHRARTLNSALR